MKLAALLVGLVLAVLFLYGLVIALSMRNSPRPISVPISEGDHEGCLRTLVMLLLATVTLSLFWYALSN